MYTERGIGGEQWGAFFKGLRRRIQGEQSKKGATGHGEISIGDQTKNGKISIYHGKGEGWGNWGWFLPRISSSIQGIIKKKRSALLKNFVFLGNYFDYEKVL